MDENIKLRDDDIYQDSTLCNLVDRPHLSYDIVLVGHLVDISMV